MKKITFLMLHLNYGGIEKQVVSLANALCDDYDITIISLYDILGSSFYTLNSKIKVKYILPYGPNKKEIIYCLKKIRLLKLIKEVIKALKIIYSKYFVIGKIANTIDTDVIISSRIEFSRQIKRDDVITIAQEHSYINTKSYEMKVKKSFKHIKYLVVMTDMAKKTYDNWLNKKNTPKVVVIPNIADKPCGIADLKSKQIISVGRLESVKDFDTAIDIFKDISLKYDDWIFKICGEGSKRKELEKKIEELSLNDKIILTGRLSIDDVNKELLNSSIFMLTSKSESFSLALCSAMAHGLPCVSFDIDVGPREIITNNEDGFLISNRDLNKMIEIISNLIEDEILRKKIGESAKHSVSRFYSENIVNIWIKLIESDLNNN